MKTAVIDLGSNTFNLKIIETDSGEILYNQKIAVKLLKGNAEIVGDEARARALNAVGEHLKTAREYGVEKGYAFATSALRSTQNGRALAQDIFDLLGVNVHIIGGLQEALFIYEGVKQAVDFSDGLIVDIGGGSTELVWVKNKQYIWGESFPLGVGRLLENLEFTDPATPKHFEALHELLEESWGQKLQELQAKHPINSLVGSSGSYDTIYDMLAARHHRPLMTEHQKNGTIDVEEMLVLSRDMQYLTTAERLEVPGLIPMRAEMIHLSLYITEYLVKKLEISDILLSAYALKEGVLSEIQNPKNPWQPSF